MMIVDGWLMIIVDGFANPLGEATGSDSNGDTGGFNGTIICKLFPYISMAMRMTTMFSWYLSESQGQHSSDL